MGGSKKRPSFAPNASVAATAAGPTGLSVSAPGPAAGRTSVSSSAAAAPVSAASSAANAAMTAALAIYAAAPPGQLGELFQNTAKLKDPLCASVRDNGMLLYVFSG